MTVIYAPNKNENTDLSDSPDVRARSSTALRSPTAGQGSRPADRKDETDNSKLSLTAAESRMLGRLQKEKLWEGLSSAWAGLASRSVGRGCWESGPGRKGAGAPGEVCGVV